MVVTGRAALLAALGAVAVLIAPWPGRATLVVAVALAALVLLVLLDVLAAGSTRAVTFRRSGPRMVRLGESVTVEVLAQNHGRRRVRGLLRDAWPPSAGAEPRQHRVSIGRGRQQLVTSTLTPTRRGDRRPAAVTLRSLGPLGVAGRQGTHRLPWSLRVVPPFLSRRHLPARLARLRDLEGQNPVQVRGQGTEFDSLREYVVGDDVRSIDWRATARRRDVMVRTWRPERDRRVLIVLDSGRTSAGRVGGWPRLDWSMDAALLLAALAAHAGDRVDFLAYDRAVRAWSAAVHKTRLLASLVDVMAPIEAELVESDFTGMVSAVLTRARRRCLVVLLTDLNPTTMREGLVPVLPLLAGTHHVLVAAVSDPQVAAMAEGRGGSEQVYDAAAAEHHRQERRRITALLRRHQVEVVDVLPDDLAPALADSYLAMKAAGRL
jgi:uncharacterized protein (DUF58 family)